MNEYTSQTATCSNLFIFTYIYSNRFYNYIINVVYSYDLMKRTTNFFILVLLVLTLCTATAGASANAACNVKIVKFTVNNPTGIAPAKVGFTTYTSGTVKSVQYQVLDKNGKVVASCRSYCTHCTVKHICNCSLIIKKPGTYDAKVTVYGAGNCHVQQIKKSAIKIKAA